jgi:hypothetical protein
VGGYRADPFPATFEAWVIIQSVPVEFGSETH